MSYGGSRGVVGVRGLLVCLVVLGVLACVPSAFAAGAPFWRINQTVAPRYIPPGGEGVVIVTATNLGDAPVQGAGDPVTFADTLPAGLTATSVEGTSLSYGGVECAIAQNVSCTFEGSLPPYEYLEAVIHVKASSEATGTLEDEARISGGGARSVSVVEPVSIGSTPAVFGVESVEMQAFNEDGSFDTQAGSHPFELTTTFNLNQRFGISNGVAEPKALPAALAKDLHFQLPAGLVGNPQVIAQCTEQQFTATPVGFANICPADTVIGVAAASFTGLFHNTAEVTIDVPLYNLVPSVGEPARFGFMAAGVAVYLDTAVRTGGDYGVSVNVDNISQWVGFAGSQVTFWGDPGDPRHNISRGPDCLLKGALGDHLHTCEEVVHAQEATTHSETPLLTLPTSCGEPWKMSVQADSWKEPSNTLEGSYTLHDDTSPAIGMDGCNKLPFEPSISVAPDGQAGSTPTGLTVGIHVPQQAALNPTGLSEADVRNTTVTLPEGVALNPAAADGLQACSTEQVGFEKIDPVSNTALFTPNAVSCPEGSKVGTVQIKTPLLPDPLEGAVYLAAQNANPFGSLVALYIVAEDPTAGVLVKLAGEAVPDPVTGQLVSTFKNTPQLPFEDLHLKFFGTARAPLNTPALCGTYTTKASIGPWSGNPPSDSSSSFDIVSGPNGAPCSNPLPFAPELTAGSTNIQAGAFTPFTLTMSRQDGNQSLSGIQLHMPAGLSGLLASVKLCKEPEAALGTCGPESEIGTTIVSVGLGGDPFTVTGGRVYITEGYKGAPYGLSIVNPAKAGPFDLGQVIVRAKIEVDPHTAALTVTSDPLPTILDGIPLQIKHVNVTIGREGFTFNPTNCSKLAITGTLSSTQGASSNVVVPFQATNCATLAFKPGFKVSTASKTSRANGASLSVKLTYPKAPFGSQANIASVKVDLPKQLPSRLTTLQKACPAATFEANPAACPSAATVGHARAITPLLPVPLEGPAIFVSHGGEAFPDLVVVLQGYGATVDLVGTTFISKAGITSSTFKTVPDVPVGSFELTLPQGKYSALAANGNLCSTKLHMPTSFVGQNGAEQHVSTPIVVTGCIKHVRHERKKTHRKKRK